MEREGILGVLSPLCLPYKFLESVGRRVLASGMARRLAKIIIIVGALQFLACFLFSIVYLAAGTALQRQNAVNPPSTEPARRIVAAALDFVWNVLLMPFGPLFERSDLNVRFMEMPWWGLLLNALSWGAAGALICSALAIARENGDGPSPENKPAACKNEGPKPKSSLLPLKDLIGITLLHFLATYAATLYDIAESMNNPPQAGTLSLIAQLFHFPLTPTVIPAATWYNLRITTFGQLVALLLLNSLMFSLFILLLIRAVKISLGKT